MVWQAYGMGLEPRIGGGQLYPSVDLAWYIQNFFSQVVGGCGIFGLFFISGLLISKDKESSRGGKGRSKRGGWYYRFLIRRMNALAVPYLGWNILVLTVVGLIASFSETAVGYVPRELPDGWLAIVHSIIGWDDSPFVQQLWYVRDIILFVVLAPVFRPLLKYLGKWAPILCFFLWLWDPLPEYIWARNIGGLFFYLSGLWMWKRHKDSTFLRKIGRLSVIPFFVVGALDAHYGWFIANPMYHRVVILLGVLTVWFLTGGMIQTRFGMSLNKAIGRHSFFLLAGFYPLQAVIKKVCIKHVATFLPFPGWTWYFVLPCLVAVLVLLIGELLSRKFSFVYKVATGGR